MSHSLNGKDVMAFNTSKKDKETCSYNEYPTCGVCGKATTKIGLYEPLKMLTLKLFCDYVIFTKNNDNYLEKD